MCYVGTGGGPILFDLETDTISSRLPPNPSVSQLPGETISGRHQWLVAYVDYVYDGLSAVSETPLFVRLPEIWKIVATLAGPVSSHRPSP